MLSAPELLAQPDKNQRPLSTSYTRRGSAKRYPLGTPNEVLRSSELTRAPSRVQIVMASLTASAI